MALPCLLWLLFGCPAWAWYLLVLAASIVGAWELLGMTHPHDPTARIVSVVATGATSAVLYSFGNDARVLLTLVVMLTISGVLVPVWRLGEIETAGLRLSAGVAAPFYVGALLTTLALLRRDGGPELVIMALAFAWMGDTGGYFFGRFLGKRKLYPRLSPKKTVAGFVGALLGAAAGGLIVSMWLRRDIPLLHSLPLAVVAGAAGQLGDLAESLMKRSTGIKDSGKLLPGHGGLLDRIDALLLVSPIVYLYALWNGMLS